MLKVISCSSSSSDVVLDSVEDSEESDAADMGRLGEQLSSAVLSFAKQGDNPAFDEFDTEIWLITTGEMEDELAATICCGGVYEATDTTREKKIFN